MEKGPSHEGGERSGDRHAFTPDERIEIGIAAAIKDNLVIDDRTARMIAANVGSIETPMLDLFATTGHMDQETFEELSRIRISQDATQQQARWIDWLGGYWLDRQRRQADATPEERARSPTYEPRAYIVDLTSFERNIDHGLWVDANQPAADLKADIAAMLDSSPIPGADSWTVGAAKGFGRQIDPVGSSSPVLISRLARGLLDHGAAYSAWVSLSGTDDIDRLGKFQDFHVATYSTPEDWLYELTDDLRWRNHLDQVVDPAIRPYVSIDHKKMFEDAMHRWDVVKGEDGRIHVFLR